MSSSWFAKALRAFRRKPRKGLRRPTRALRWVVSKQSKLLYLALLCWPRVLVFCLALWAAFAVRIPPTSTLPWLYKTNKVLAALLMGMYLSDAVFRAFRSWNRRHSQTAGMVISAPEDGS